MILSAQSIWAREIITPSHPRTVVRGMTYGVSAAGYDVRIDFEGLGYDVRRLAVPTTLHCTEHPDFSLDPYRNDPDSSFLLAATLEHFNMPDDVMGIVHDKSSWARRGVAVQNTVIEPGWRGHLTLEITMHGPRGTQVIIQHGDPIAQIVFHQLDEPTTIPYKGKYQDQAPGPQPAIDEIP